MNGKEFLSVQETAELFGVCELTIFRWLKEGRLAGAKAGRKWLINRRHAIMLASGNTVSVIVTGLATIETLDLSLANHHLAKLPAFFTELGRPQLAQLFQSFLDNLEVELAGRKYGEVLETQERILAEANKDVEKGELVPAGLSEKRYIEALLPQKSKKGQKAKQGRKGGGGLK